MFLLRKPARSCDPVFLNGWTTGVAGGQRAVITCGSSTAGTADIFTEALEAANTGLDYLSATGATHSLIVDASDDYIAWSPDGSGGVTMRAKMTVSMPFNMSATGVVTEPDGTIRQSPAPPTPIARDVFRFMRMAKTSGDLFDAYRNLFLAFECLLDDIHPHRAGREGDWFKAALAAANALVPIAPLAPANEPDPIDWIYQNVYGSERSGLMHAKQRRGYLIPHDNTGRAALRSSLESLWRYVRELVAEHLNVRSGSAYLSQYGWAQIADPVLQMHKPFVSEDASQVADTDGPLMLDTSVGLVEAAPGAPAPDPDDPMVRTIAASFDPVALRELRIRKIGAMTSETTPSVLAVSELTGPLIVGADVSRFELVLGLRSFSANGAPTVFSS